MAGWQATNRQGNFRAIGALIVLHALGFVAPAAASSNNFAVCDDRTKDALRFSTTVLQPVARNNADESELAAPEIVEAAALPSPDPSPAMEAALRRAAENTPALDRNSVDSNTVNPPAMTTRVPGISDEAMARYKKQMYRKDI